MDTLPLLLLLEHAALKLPLSRLPPRSRRERASRGDLYTAWSTATRCVLTADDYISLGTRTRNSVSVRSVCGCKNPRRHAAGRQSCGTYLSSTSRTNSSLIVVALQLEAKSRRDDRRIRGSLVCRRTQQAFLCVRLAVHFHPITDGYASTIAGHQLSQATVTPIASVRSTQPSISSLVARTQDPPHNTRIIVDSMAPKKTQQEDAGISENEVRALLIGKDGNLTRDFEAVLTRLFISFLEKPTDKSLTLDKLKEFSKICNDGKPFSDEEIKEIQTYFQCDENKGLTLKGFKDMYHTQSSAEPMETWRDMKKLGFDKELIEKREAALRCRVCKAPSTLVCSRCKTVRYCGADCQKQDWKASHKQKCKPSEV